MNKPEDYEKAIRKLSVMHLGLSEDCKTACEMAINSLNRERQFLEAGYKNGRVEFNIGGRRFMVKELAQ